MRTIRPLAVMVAILYGAMRVTAATSVTDFGALGNRASDDTSAFQAAVNAAAPNGGRIIVPKGTYNISRPITIPTRGVVFVGEGLYATLLRFIPSTSGQSLFYFNPAGRADYYGGGLENLGMTVLSPKAGTIAVRVRNAAHFTVRQVATWEWNDPSHTSIGLQLQGREFLRIEGSLIYADRPMVIENNPDLWLDFDHGEVIHSGFVAYGTQPAITIADGVYMSNSAFTNVNLGGSHGVFWKDSSAERTSHNVLFKNMRWEQATNGAGWFLYISRTGSSYLNNLVIDSVAARNNTATNGIYLRKVRGVDLTNSDIGYETWYSGKVAIDADSTVSSFSIAPTTLTRGQLLGIRR